MKHQQTVKNSIKDLEDSKAFLKRAIDEQRERFYQVGDADQEQHLELSRMASEEQMTSQEISRIKSDIAKMNASLQTHRTEVNAENLVLIRLEEQIANKEIECDGLAEERNQEVEDNEELEREIKGKNLAKKMKKFRIFFLDFFLIFW